MEEIESRLSGAVSSLVAKCQAIQTDQEEIRRRLTVLLHRFSVVVECFQGGDGQCLANAAEKLLDSAAFAVQRIEESKPEQILDISASLGVLTICVTDVLRLSRTLSRQPKDKRAYANVTDLSLRPSSASPVRKESRSPSDNSRRRAGPPDSPSGVRTPPGSAGAARPSSRGGRSSRSPDVPNGPIADTSFTSEPWFVGDLSRAQAEVLLQSHHQDVFLVRSSSRPQHYALTAFSTRRKGCLHFLFGQNDGLWKIMDGKETTCYRTVQELIDATTGCHNFKPFRQRSEAPEYYSDALTCEPGVVTT